MGLTRVFEPIAEYWVRIEDYRKNSNAQLAFGFRF